MRAAQASAALTAHCVYFIYKNQTGSGFFGFLEKISHATGADTHKHFHKLRTGDMKKWHLGFTGYGPGQQGLAGAGRAQEQDSSGYLSSQRQVFLRLLEEVHDFLE